MNTLFGILARCDSLGFETVRIMVSLLWQSSIVLGAAWVLSFILKDRRASIRYMIWVTALLVIPLLPFLTTMLSNTGTPKAEIRVLPVYSPPETRMEMLPSPLPRTVHEEPGHAKPLEIDLPIQNVSRNVHTEQIADEPEPAFQFPSLKAFPWAFALGGYALIALGFILLIARESIHVRIWVTSGEGVMDSRVMNMFERVRERLGIKREIIVVEHDCAPGPMTCRTFRPVVILPTGFADTVTDTELHAVAVHELTHIKYHHMLVLTLVSYLRAVLFFHPLVWFAARELSCLAEGMSDASVLETTGEPVVYADMLSRMAQRLKGRALSTDLVVGIIFSKSMFYRRISEILNVNSKTLQRLSRRASAFIGLAGITALTVSILLPLGYALETKDSVTVSGKVLYDGKPVQNANIYFHNASRKILMKVARSDRKGTFVFSVKKKVLGSSMLETLVLAAKEGYGFGSMNVSGNTGFQDIIVSMNDSGEITGTVKDTAGNPIAGAEVVPWVVYLNKKGAMNVISQYGEPIPEMTAITDDMGHCSLRGIPDGAYTMLRIHKNGYGDNFYRDQQDQFDIVLQPEAIISGKVAVAESGTPATGSVVVAFSSSRVPFETKVGNDGTYSIGNLSPGTYSLHCMPSKAFREMAVVSMANVEISESEHHSGMDFNLHPGIKITGKVLDAKTINPIPNLRVVFQNDVMKNAYFQHYSSVTDENGEYAFYANPGKAVISPQTPDGYTSLETPKNELSVVAGPPVAVEPFYFAEGIMLKGTVRTMDGKPVAGTTITTNKRTHTYSRENGTFSLRGFTTGEKVILRASNEEQLLRGSANIEVSPDTNVELLMKKYKTENLQGRVMNDAGDTVSGAKVEGVYMDRDLGSGYTVSTALTDENGSYTLKNLIIGESYLVKVRASGYMSPPLMRDDEITITENMPPANDIVMISANKSYEGRIVDENGNPVSKARVSVQRSSSSALSGDDGEFKLDQLAEDIIRIHVSHPDFGQFDFRDVILNKPRDFKLLKGQYSLSGVVRDEKGNPLSDAQVIIDPSETGKFYGFVNTGRDGKFTFDGIIEKTTTVSVSHENYSYKTVPDVSVETENLVVALDAKRPEEPKDKENIRPRKIESFAVPYVGASMRMNIDGDLSDWAPLGLAGQKLSIPDFSTATDNAEYGTMFRGPDSERDTYATTKCFADKDYLYVAMSVEDDTLLFGQQPLTRMCGTDDTALLWLYNGQKPEPMSYIWLAADKDGQVVIGGRDLIAWEEFPYMLEAVGVKAGINVTDQHYTVEYAVPWAWLEKGGIARDGYVGINVRVYDRDNDSDPFAKKLLEWAGNGLDDHRQLVFTDAPANLKVKETSKIPSKAEQIDEICSFLELYKEEDWDAALQQLETINDDRFTVPAQATLLTKAKREKDACEPFSIILENHKKYDDYVDWWAVESLTRNSSIRMFKHEYDDAMAMLASVQSMPLNHSCVARAAITRARVAVMKGESQTAKQIINEFLNAPEARDGTIPDQLVSSAREFLEQIQ